MYSLALVKGCGALYLLPAEVEYVFDLPPAVSATANHAAEYSRRAQRGDTRGTLWAVRLRLTDAW